MSAQKPLESATSLLQPWAKNIENITSHHLNVMLDVVDLTAAVDALHAARWGYLGGITGLDLGLEAGLIEVLYHFFAGSAMLTLRLRIPRDKASVPSICPIISSATFYERELMEMMGVSVVGTPNADRLFLPDSWPDGVYPLRKDFAGKEVNA